MGREEGPGSCIQRNDVGKTAEDKGRSRAISWNSFAIIQAKAEMVWFRVVTVEGVRNYEINKNNKCW